MKKMMITSMLPLTTCLVTCCSLSAEAQGVLLTAGDTVSIEFNGFDGCHPFDGGIASSARVLFGDNMLDPGESLRLEMFANTVNDPAFATQVFSPGSSVPFVQISGPVSGWLDNQGLVRVTMLSGSVDVFGAHFFVDQTSQYCDAVVAVPEPSVAMVIALASVVGAVAFSFRRIRGPNPHRAQALSGSNDNSS